LFFQAVGETRLPSSSPTAARREERRLLLLGAGGAVEMVAGEEAEVCRGM